MQNTGSGAFPRCTKMRRKLQSDVTLNCQLGQVFMLYCCRVADATLVLGSKAILGPPHVHWHDAVFPCSFHRMQGLGKTFALQILAPAPKSS